MAREFAKVLNSIWLDDDWRDLTASAQHLYLVMLTDPQLSYAGVTDWRPKRIIQKAKEWSLFDCYRAAVELSEKLFLVIDEDTEEAFVRSFMRHDEIMKNPRLAVSAVKAYGDIASNKIRQAFVWELLRLKEADNSLSGLQKPQVISVMRNKACDPRDMVTELTVPDEALPGSLAIFASR